MYSRPFDVQSPLHVPDNKVSKQTALLRDTPVVLLSLGTFSVNQTPLGSGGGGPEWTEVATVLAVGPERR